MIRSKRLLFLFRLIVGGVFVWAGILKIADPLEFAQNIKNYHFFPHEMIFFIAIVLPWVEVLSGGFLILGIFRRSSALIISVLLAVFIGLVGLALLRGIDTSCGCFGSFSRKADLSLILADAILLFFSLSILKGQALERRTVPAGKASSAA
ncbi:MAG: MauE/DoxX family redox-associated membrane protein [Clostridiales bacterium]|nr:MauE/DoxX family redox-associated membrane protein [Clostridiales bacterium]